jgi:hypothetical protein
LLYRYLKYTCGIPNIRVLSIVLYTNSTIKGKEDFVRFLRYEDFPDYLEARQEVLADEEVKKAVESLKSRDIRLNDEAQDSAQEASLEKDEAAESLKLMENTSGGDMA